ncbi:hypothetical protein Tco_0894394 [Tanacetum coccineum]|uniref:Uncharacterized protein n=1 Tax=Tanacetum coccineum TaxID=301880 RepID=A0ABQ5CD28_9ASTR
MSSATLTGYLKLQNINGTSQSKENLSNKDTEDPSWSTSFKTRRTQKTSSALEDFMCVVFVPDRNIVRLARTRTVKLE